MSEDERERHVASRHLSYVEVADRIDEALGVRPALSTLRAAAADSRRGTSRTRVTTGMPAPITPPRPGIPTEFSATAVDRWLAKHPWREIRMRQERIMAASPAHRARVVRRARVAG